MCRNFHSFVLEATLSDIDFSDPSYTWKRGLLFERLDLALGNGVCLTKFSELTVQHLTRVGSDQCPLLIDFGDVKRRSMCAKPFKIFKVWMNHSSLRDTVLAAWRQEATVGENLNKIASVLEVWNKEVFGNIFQRKRRLANRIRGVQRALEVSDSNFLLNLEKDLLGELEEVLYQEESFWNKKSRQ